MEKTEHCAVVGISTRNEAVLLDDLYTGLCALQHRGQESVGVSIYNHKIHTLKSMGLVSESTLFLNPLAGTLGIGHERYSTTGQSILENAQPFEMKSKYGVPYSFAFNGNIRNLALLKSFKSIDIHIDGSS